MLTTLAARRLMVAALLTLVSLTGLAGPAPLSASAATDDPNGVGLTVPVLGPTASASPSSSPTSTTSTPMSGGSTPSTTNVTSSTPVVTQTTVTGGAAVTHALGTDPTGINGAYSVSGVTLTSEPDIGPGGGSITLGFTLRNVTATPITSSLKFWTENVIGTQLASVDTVNVADLGAGETRTVVVTLPDVGQWTVFTGNVTLTPPAEVRGTALSPVSRDSLIIVPPYFALVALAGFGALYIALRYVHLLRRAPVDLVGAVAS